MTLCCRASAGVTLDVMIVSKVGISSERFRISDELADGLAKRRFTKKAEGENIYIYILETGRTGRCVLTKQI